MLTFTLILPQTKTMARDISQIRRDYSGNYLTKETVGTDPIAFFNRWFDEALHAQVVDANAMTLSTVSAEGLPDGRIVLLKGVEEGKFIFYTNYQSKKGRDLAANPVAALTFYYKELDRQIRVTGKVSKCPPQISDAYFKTRPLKSRIGAWVSAQSQPIPSRFYLMRQFARYSLGHLGQPVERPPFWGGYALSPTHIEFWQGRPNRLHDRIDCRLVDNQWQVERLSP